MERSASSYGPCLAPWTAPRALDRSTSLPALRDKGRSLVQCGWRGMGPSSLALQENYRQERFVHQADRAAVPGPLPLGRKSSMEEREERSRQQATTNFVEGMDSLDSLLKRLGQEMRRNETPEEKRRRLEREAARRRRDDNLQRARERQENSRNPRAKVALRLEQRRMEAALATSLPEREEGKVPMVRMDFGGARGTEHVDMVDVAMLRARCKGLADGASVKTLLEIQRKRDEDAEMRPRGNPGAAKTPGALAA